MSNDLTPDQAAFRQFELDGWKTSAPVYFDAIVGVNSQSVPALLDAAGVAAGVRVLDLACGPGHIAAAAAQRGAQVTGVDFSPQMLAQARRRYPDIAFQAGDAEALPLADASVDAVVMGYALFHFARPERALAECARVLRPGGRVAFTAWALPVPGSALAIANACLKAHATLDLGLPEGTPFHRFSEPDECRRVLTAAGFVDVLYDPGLRRHHQAEQIRIRQRKPDIRSPHRIERIQPRLRLRHQPRRNVDAMPEQVAVRLLRDFPHMHPDAHARSAFVGKFQRRTDAAQRRSELQHESVAGRVEHAPAMRLSDALDDGPQVRDLRDRLRLVGFRARRISGDVESDDGGEFAGQVGHLRGTGSPFVSASKRGSPRSLS